jgi:hypothetical protein
MPDDKPLPTDPVAAAFARLAAAMHAVTPLSETCPPPPARWLKPRGDLIDLRHAVALMLDLNVLLAVAAAVIGVWLVWLL